MPKSGKVKQVCPCGSAIPPYIAISLSARSLHIRERVMTAGDTLYICSRCVKKFRASIAGHRSFVAILDEGTRDRILELAAQNIVAIWEEIGTQVPSESTT
jgi:hypothetical protein